MKTIPLKMLLVAIFLGSCGPGSPHESTSLHDGSSELEALRARANETRRHGREAVDAFYHGRLSELQGLFGKQLADGMDEEALAEFSRYIVETYGELVDVQEQEVFERDGAMVYAASLLTSRSDEPILFLTVWDSKWRITQIRILPQPRLGAN